MKRYNKFPKYLFGILILLLIAVVGANDYYAYKMTTGDHRDKVNTGIIWHLITIFGYIFSAIFIANKKVSEAVSHFVVLGGFLLAVWFSYLSCMRM